MAYTIITHDRKAHMDEVLASALLSIHLQEDPEEILRLPSRMAEEKVRSGRIADGEWLVDCGMAFDQEKRVFDHHQDSALGCAALLVFETYFPHLRDSELGEYIRLVSRVDNGGLRVLDDYESVHESQSYWSFSQKLLLRSFEETPKAIVSLFRTGLEDKIRFEQAKQKAALWLKTEEHTSIETIGEMTILVYHTPPPTELASAIRAVDGEIVDREEADAIYSFDDKEPGNRVFFRTNWGHNSLDFNRARPEQKVFCHQGGFLLKFTPSGEEEWRRIAAEAFITD